MSQRIEVILSCFILIAMFLISLEHKRAPLINSRIRTTCLLLAFALAATNLGMGIAGLKQVPEIRDHSKKVFVINDIPHNVTTVGVLSSACSQFGDMKYYRALEDLLFDILHQQHPSDISDYDEEHLFIPPASEKLVKIGMVLVGVAFHLEDHMNPEMTYYDWDQTKDQDLLFYSGILHNRSYDTSLPIEELRALSRYVSYLGNVAMIKTTMEAVTYHYGLDDDELRQTHDLLDKQLEFRLDQIVVVSGALFCLGVFYFSMFIAAVAIKEVNEKYDANQLGMSLGTQIEKMSYALGLVFMLITGIFVFSIVRMDVAEGAVSRIATSASREWLLSASMLSINRIAHNINTIELHSLETTLSDIKSAHHRLYFHHKDTSTYNGVGLDSKQDELLFGHHVTIPIQYKPNTGCTIRDSHIQEILTHGLHSAVEKWITYSAAVLSLARGESSDREHMILAVTADMRVQYESLIDALYYSTSLYLTDAIATEDETASSMTIAVCCAIFLMLLDFFMIFKPIMKGLFQDEKITGLILRLIPSHLIDQQDFTTNGNDDRGSKVSDMVTEMSPIPLIAIDHNGIIAKFSQNAVRECFQYQAVELTGTNLKILMPEEFASKHDQYLAHYRRTRIKKIIDRARIVRGRRKDGEEFPAEVMVRQFKCLGEDMYIGFIRDLTSDVALKSSARQNKLIQEMNRSCVINVDPMGTILSVNRAMTVDFGYQPEELLGENIKMIMPSSVAVMHDTYLENYRNSGKKTILGVTLSSTAQKKNGDLFSIQLKADAIDCDPPEYIGFIRNTVNEARLRAQNDVNSGIVENFPTSCVLIDQLGTILKFGRAAERDFGYSAKNAVGQNIKILMPLSIANQHDQFLSTYAKTRVKRVIGSSRNTEGKHRDGGVFQIKITVAEVENKTLGSNAYIGFVEDMTQWNLIKMNQDVNRVVFEQSCEPIIVISNEGIILQINKNALNAFGYLKDEVLNQNIKMLMPPHVGDIHDGYLAAYLRTGVKTVIDNIMRVVGKRKDNCDLHLSLRVIEIEVAEKTCYCGFARDLTEEIAGQVTFKNNEAIMQISAEGVVVIDRFGIIIRFNHQAQKIWGYSEIEMVGANVSELCPPTHAEKHDGYLVAYAKTGIKHVIDAKVKVDAVKKGGMEFQTNLRVKELKTDHGNYFVGFTADAMMEAKVHVQSETYSELRKAIPVCWLTIDTYGTIKNFGSKAIEQFQFSEEEALGNNVSMLMPPDIAAKHDGFLKRYRVSGFNRIGPEGTKVTAKRKDGAPVDIHLNMDGFSIPTATGSMDEFVVAFAVDITELLQYQQVIANINKIVDVSFNGIIVIDSFGTILKFSKAASKMFGYTEKEVISKNIKVLMGEPHKSQHDGYLNAYKRTGVGKIVGTQTMVEGRSKTGDVVPVILSLVQISLNGDSIFMGNIVDASVQRRAHLFHKKNLVATEMSTSSIIVTDTIGTILRANQATFDLFGYTSEEIVGSNVKMLTPPEIAENHDGYLKKYLQTGEATVMGKTTVLKAIDKWGTQFSIELRLNEIHKLDDNNYIAFIDDRRAEEQAETHRLVQNLEVHLSVDPLIGMDADGTVNLFTKSAELLSGFTADEVIGQNIKMLMPEEIAIKHDGYLDAFRRTRIKTVVDTDAQVYVKHKDGHVITVASVIREIIKENGSYSFVGFLCDNSEYEDAKHKEALGECILENNPVAMISIDDVGTIQQFNLAAEQEFGYNASVAVGKNIKIIIPDEVAVKHDGYLKRYRETKIARIIGSPQKLTAMTSGRERIPISLTIVPVRTGKGDEERYVSFIESLAVNMLFEYTESLVAAMIHLCPVPLVVADQQGIIERFSGSAEELFEQDSDILGKNVSLLLPEEIAVKHDGYLKRYKMTGVARVIGKVTRGYNGLTKSGKEFPCQLAVKEIKKEGRESTYVACVLDITEIAKVEHQVELGKAITKSSTMPLISISSTGMARCYSRSAEELFGFTEEEIVGNNIKIMMPEETAINHDGYLERYKKTRIKKVIDTTRQVKAKHKSGYGIDVILKVKELCVQGTTIYVSYITDLTVQLNLAWESKLHHTLVSGVKDPVIVMGTDSKIISLNKATAEVFQFEPDQLINRHVRLLMPDETSARHDNYVSVHLRSRKPEPLNAKRYITAERKDGSPVRAFIHIIEVRLSGGEIRFLSKMQIQK